MFLLAFSLLLPFSTPDWLLIEEVGLDTIQNGVQHLSVQFNGTNSEIAVANGSQTEYFLKRVSGDSPANGPGWATWLTPLSYSNPSVTYAWPSTGMTIDPGKTYYFGYKFDLESGSQLWEKSSVEAFRSRYWKTQGTVIEDIIP
ncbi:MAG TPA: hypothetical protein VJ835_10325 [Fimbriimonadaceae bacterium]|nr:hypothetical protein [Fimbriimonadaceae bacterium]